MHRLSDPNSRAAGPFGKAAVCEVDGDNAERNARTKMASETIQNARRAKKPEESQLLQG
jgi:hypothetical protein